MKDHRLVLLQSVLSEKSLLLKERENAYVFRVDRRANKKEIKEAVERGFGVKVVHVRTMTIPGKPKRLNRFEGRTPAWKKAIVKLKEGEQISEFDNI